MGGVFFFSFFLLLQDAYLEGVNLDLAYCMVGD